MSRLPPGLSNMLLLIFALPALLSPLAMAQDDSLPSTTSDTMPNVSDNASHSQGQSNAGGLVNYYFVFFALIIAIAGLAAYFYYKKKRKQSMMAMQGRDGAIERDLNSWDPIRARRRYWQGGWRSEEHSREEGLNEFGEAPPPYVPKTRDEEAGLQNRTNGPAVPMPALSREHAGLKPPDYTTTSVHPVDEQSRTSTANDSSSLQQPQATQQAPHMPDQQGPQAPRYG